MPILSMFSSRALCSFCTFASSARSPLTLSSPVLYPVLDHSFSLVSYFHILYRMLFFFIGIACYFCFYDIDRNIHQLQERSQNSSVYWFQLLVWLFDMQGKRFYCLLKEWLVFHDFKQYLAGIASSGHYVSLLREGSLFFNTRRHRPSRVLWWW